MRGQFQGTLTSENGERQIGATLKLGGIPKLGKAVSADPERSSKSTSSTPIDPPRKSAGFAARFRAVSGPVRGSPDEAITSICMARSASSTSWR